jgi:hypothetical protein
MDTSNSSAFDISNVSDLKAMLDATAADLERLNVCVEYITLGTEACLIQVCVWESTGTALFRQIYNFESDSDTCVVTQHGVRQDFSHQEGLVLLMQQIERTCLIETRERERGGHAAQLRALAHRFFLTYVKLQSEMYAQADRVEMTTQALQRFVGGQMEIQNSSDDYLCRGEVKTIAVEGDDLHVTFTWFARGEGSFPIPQKWMNDVPVDYAVSLSVCSVSNIGPSGDGIGGSDRLHLVSSILGETIVLYPPDGSRLDPATVEGLQVA